MVPDATRWACWSGLSPAAAKTLVELLSCRGPSGYVPLRDLPDSFSDRHRRRALDELARAEVGRRVHGGFVLSAKTDTGDGKRTPASVSGPPTPPRREEERDAGPHPLVEYWRQSAARWLDAGRARRATPTDNQLAEQLTAEHGGGWMRQYIDWWTDQRLFGPVWSFRVIARAIPEYERQLARRDRQARRRPTRPTSAPQTTLAAANELPVDDVDVLAARTDSAATRLLRSITPFTSVQWMLDVIRLLYVCNVGSEMYVCLTDATRIEIWGRLTTPATALRLLHSEELVRHTIGKQPYRLGVLRGLGKQAPPDMCPANP